VKAATRAAAAAPPSLSCPSAQPDMEGAVVFGVVGGSVEQPEVSYLEAPIPVTEELLALTTPVEPTEVFRFAAPCAERGCRHFDGDACGLARALTRELHAESGRLAPCRLRPTCRWWHEQGSAACRRCRLIVTTDYAASEALRKAAAPPQT
jgi:hypothetical protein